jgi:single-strand DNA-binding protein
MYMNRVTLVGSTGAEAKHTNTQGGKGITRFSLATAKSFKSGNDCVVYNTSLKVAETIQKGDHLLIEGELSYREYERTIETTEGLFKCNAPNRKSLSTGSLASTDQRNRKREPLLRRLSDLGPNVT